MLHGSLADCITLTNQPSARFLWDMFVETALSAEPEVGLGTITFRLLVVLFLVLLNAFFVAAEFALVAVRRSKIDQMAAAGDSSAMVVQRALSQLDRYISGEPAGHRSGFAGPGLVR